MPPVNSIPLLFLICLIVWIKNSDYEIEINYDFECYYEGDSNSDDYVSGIRFPLKFK